MKYAILSLMFLVGCGQGPAGQNGVVTTVTNPLTTVQAIVANENDYRNSVGQESLFPGLTCTLYTVPTTATQIIGVTLTTVGSFNFTGVFNQPNSQVTDGLNILPTGLKNYQSWYVLKCLGSLVVGDSNWHTFDLSSDDGSNLYIDGLLINNDGLHGIQTKSASKLLKYGIHSFELDFLEANGNQALILNQDGNVMSNTGFYH